MALPAVLIRYRANESNDRLLLALCGAMRHLPQAVVQQHADALAPLVLSAVKRATEAKSTATAAVEAVRALLATGSAELPSVLVRSASDSQQLALSLLAVARGSTVPESRCAALVALGDVCTSVPYRSIFPIKDKLLDQLGALLNDKKRTVRREAARTRNAIYVLGVATA